MRKDGGGTGDTKRGGVWETSFRRVPLPLKRVPWPNSVSYKTQFTYQYMSPINSECKSYIVVWCWSRKPNNIVGGAALGIRRNKNTWTETGSKQEAVMCSKTSGKTNSKKKNMQIWSYTSAALLWHMTQLYNTSCSNLALQYIQKACGDTPIFAAGWVLELLLIDWALQVYGITSTTALQRSVLNFCMGKTRGAELPTHTPCSNYTLHCKNSPLPTLLFPLCTAWTLLWNVIQL